MVGVSTPFARQFLRTLAEGAETSSITLLDALKTAASGKVTSAGDGRYVIQSTANGHSTQWNIHDTDASPGEILEMISELRDRYEEAYNALIAAGESDPADSDILAEMLDKLRPIRRVASDFSNLRVPQEADDVEETVATAVPANSIIFSSDLGISGSPEGVVEARKKRQYLDESTGSFWIKTTDSGKTGWFPITQIEL